MIKAIAAVALGAALLAAGAPARADTVTEWNLNATNALIVSAAQPPQVSVPHLAMVHGAIYDAVNAIDGGYEPYLGSPSATGAESKDAAATAAAYQVLLNILPLREPQLTGYYQASLALIPDGPAEDDGVAIG